MNKNAKRNFTKAERPMERVLTIRRTRRDGRNPVVFDPESDWVTV